MRLPYKRTHCEVGVQQSVDARQGAPSSEHAPLHVSVDSAGPQLPAQHSAVKPQAPPSETQLPATACTPQRLTPLRSPTHCVPAQQSVAEVQKSPFEPQPLRRWQRATPSPPTTHEPEQQSASIAHSSQTLMHPPAGAQRLTLSGVERHRREQQSTSPAQASPT